MEKVESGLSQETVSWMTHGGETAVTFSDPTPATVSITTLWLCLLRFLPAGRSDSSPDASVSFASASSEQAEAEGFCLGFFFFWNKQYPQFDTATLINEAELWCFVSPAWVAVFLGVFQQEVSATTRWFRVSLSKNKLWGNIVVT